MNRFVMISVLVLAKGLQTDQTIETVDDQMAEIDAMAVEIETMIGVVAQMKVIEIGDKEKRKGMIDVRVNKVVTIDLDNRIVVSVLTIDLIMPEDNKDKAGVKKVVEAAVLGVVDHVVEIDKQVSTKKISSSGSFLLYFFYVTHPTPSTRGTPLLLREGTGVSCSAEEKNNLYGFCSPKH